MQYLGSRDESRGAQGQCAGQITATKRALAAMRNEVDLVVAPSAQMCEKGAGRDLMTFAELYQAVGYV